MTDGVKESPFVYPEGLHLNLSKISSDTIIPCKVTVTGTLDGNKQPYKISIADGATVTLRDATIMGVSTSTCKFAGLNCLGSAKIILEGKNKVVGFYSYYPGIFVPYDEELTIEGDGELVTWSNGSGAGIGGGYKMDCGSIFINGGTIDATGGYGAAAIGGGWNATCENIGITQCVTQVKATKAYPSASPYSVGPGDNGTFHASIIVGSDCFYPYLSGGYYRNPGIEDAVFIYPEPSGLEDIQTNNIQGSKVLIDGQLYIKVNDHLYDAQGKEVR